MQQPEFRLFLLEVARVSIEQELKRKLPREMVPGPRPYVVGKGESGPVAFTVTLAPQLPAGGPSVKGVAGGSSAAAPKPEKVEKPISSVEDLLHLRRVRLDGCRRISLAQNGASQESDAAAPAALERSKPAGKPLIEELKPETAAKKPTPKPSSTNSETGPTILFRSDQREAGEPAIGTQILCPSWRDALSPGCGPAERFQKAAHPGASL